MPTRLAILGSTGSIGTQALQVVREQKEHFEVELLTCGNNADAADRAGEGVQPERRGDR